MAITKGTAIITNMPTDVTTTFNVPTYVAGDVWIAILATRATTDFSVTTGWTLVANNRASTTGAGVRQVIWYRVPDGTEGSTQSITKTGNSSTGTAVVYPMSGVDTTTVIDGIPGLGNGGTTLATSLPNPGITTSYANSFLFDVQGGNLLGNDIVFTQPSGMTKDVDDDGAVGGYTDINVNYEQLGAAGATGARDGSCDLATRWHTTTFALKDASTGGSPGFTGWGVPIYTS